MEGKVHLGDAAAEGLGPLAAAEVDEVEPRAAAQEDVGGVGGVRAVAHRVLVHVQREDEVGVPTLKSFGGLVEIFLKFYEIFLIICICEHQPLPRRATQHTCESTDLLLRAQSR